MHPKLAARSLETLVALTCLPWLSAGCEPGGFSSVHILADAGEPHADDPGYFVCAQGDTNALCSPGQLCCLPGACVAADSCQRFVSECDGPEDCAAGERCWAGAKAQGTCSPEAPADLQAAPRCHADADCKHAECSGANIPTYACPVCAAGLCTAAATPDSPLLEVPSLKGPLAAAP